MAKLERINVGLQRFHCKMAELERINVGLQRFHCIYKRTYTILCAVILQFNVDIIIIIIIIIPLVYYLLHFFNVDCEEMI